VQGGAYLLLLMDDCAMSWGLLVIAFLETVAIFWIYGKCVVCQALCKITVVVGLVVVEVAVTVAVVVVD